MKYIQPIPTVTHTWHSSPLTEQQLDIENDKPTEEAKPKLPSQEEVELFYNGLVKAFNKHQKKFNKANKKASLKDKFENAAKFILYKMAQNIALTKQIHKL